MQDRQHRAGSGGFADLQVEVGELVEYCLLRPRQGQTDLGEPVDPAAERDGPVLHRAGVLEQPGEATVRQGIGALPGLGTLVGGSRFCSL